jgi:chemotaxis protein MotB
MERLRRRLGCAGILFVPLLAVGCVSTDTHTKTVEQLEALKKSSAADLENAQRQAEARIKALEEEKAKLTQELSAEQSAGSRTRQALVNSNENLNRALAAQRQREEEAGKLLEEARQAQITAGELRRERDLLRAKSDDLERKLQTLEQDRETAEKAAATANQHLSAAEKDKEQLAASLRETQNALRDAKTQLAAEQSKVAALQEDKQKLLGGTTTAQDEIARLQRRAGELETDAARAKDLEQRLSERDQQIGTLRQEVADRTQVNARAALLAEDVEKGRQRIAALTSELAAMSEDAARVKQEREQLARDLKQAQDRLHAEEAEKTRLEQERAAKEAEIARLTRTHEDLTKSLQAEIEKGDIKIRQVRDRLTINMVDRVLFDSGQAQVKPAGLKVLKQVSDILKTVTDKQIRIEGHTDNVPIGAKLREKFATNWELSTARATSVVRYLIEEGGVDRMTLAAGGYADTRPVDTNDTEAGKASNRRIEIVLYPKDLSEIARPNQ